LRNCRRHHEEPGRARTPGADRYSRRQPEVCGTGPPHGRIRHYSGAAPSPHACWRPLRRVCVIWALHVPECAAGRQKCHSAAALIQKDPMMDTRSTSSQITFRRPFRLSGVDGLQPAGSYTLTVEEERLDTLSVDAWRRTSATLYVPQGGA